VGVSRVLTEFVARRLDRGFDVPPQPADGADDGGQIANPRLDCIFANWGIETEDRYIRTPTIAEALFCYRRSSVGDVSIESRPIRRCASRGPGSLLGEEPERSRWALQKLAATTP
jgi:hypothetical protein